MVDAAGRTVACRAKQQWQRIPCARQSTHRYVIRPPSVLRLALRADHRPVPTWRDEPWTQDDRAERERRALAAAGLRPTPIKPGAANPDRLADMARASTSKPPPGTQSPKRSTPVVIRDTQSLTITEAIGIAVVVIGGSAAFDPLKHAIGL